MYKKNNGRTTYKSSRRPGFKKLEGIKIIEVEIKEMFLSSIINI